MCPFGENDCRSEHKSERTDMWNARWKLRLGFFLVFLIVLIFYQQRQGILLKVKHNCIFLPLKKLWRLLSNLLNQKASMCSPSSVGRKDKAWLMWVSPFLLWSSSNNFLLFQREELLLQTRTLIKTIVLFSARPVTIHIVNNDVKLFHDIAAFFMANHVASDDARTFEEVAISFVPDHNKWQPFRWDKLVLLMNNDKKTQPNPTGCPKKMPFHNAVGSITSSRHRLCLEIEFLAVSYLD